jgi:hypothetical protein
MALRFLIENHLADKHLSNCCLIDTKLFRGLCYKTLHICNKQNIDRVRSKIVVLSIVNHKQTSLDKHTGIGEGHFTKTFTNKNMTKHNSIEQLSQFNPSQTLLFNLYKLCVNDIFFVNCE